MKIYHNARCSKSRCVLDLIRSKGIEPEIVEYLKNPPTVKELKGLLKMLKLKPQDILRKDELIYREKFGKEERTDEQLIELMSQYPTLIERPIVVEGKRAVIGRPPEKVLELME